LAVFLDFLFFVWYASTDAASAAIDFKRLLVLCAYSLWSFPLVSLPPLKSQTLRAPFALVAPLRSNSRAHAPMAAPKRLKSYTGRVFLKPGGF